jgi:hypothetical protein
MPHWKGHGVKTTSTRSEMVLVVEDEPAIERDEALRVSDRLRRQMIADVFARAEDAADVDALKTRLWGAARQS